jgi:hypothetical protein
MVPFITQALITFTVPEATIGFSYQMKTSSVDSKDRVGPWVELYVNSET